MPFSNAIFQCHFPMPFSSAVFQHRGVRKYLRTQGWQKSLEIVFENGIIKWHLKMS
jgi:hypothetical protein